VGFYSQKISSNLNNRHLIIKSRVENTGHTLDWKFLSIKAVDSIRCQIIRIVGVVMASLDHIEKVIFGREKLCSKVRVRASHNSGCSNTITELTSLLK